MKLLQITITLTIALSQTVLARYPRRGRPNAIMGALQNLLAPGCNERIAQMRLQNPRLAIEEVNAPNVRVVQPKYPCQQEIIYSKAPGTIATNFPVPMAPIPALVLPTTPVVPVAPMPAPIVPIAPPLPQLCPIVQEKCSCCPSPAPLVSPFLPSASPVSALAPPTSNLLPPVQPSQTKSHFLRKIPIPPPTL